jgi:hypothetical protein
MAVQPTTAITNHPSSKLPVKFRTSQPLALLNATMTRPSSN